MKSMYIGSGDVAALLSGKETITHRKLLQRFVSDDIPSYNAKSSPIDQFRTGAILEDRFYAILDDSYLPQYKIEHKIFNVCKSTLDFAKIENMKATDFIELKSVFVTDYMEINMYRDTPDCEYLPFLKRKYKHNYEQVQYQLLCTELHEANICYLEVQTYDDEVNRTRDIQPDEYIMFRITRDDSVINSIRERLTPFQNLKDYYVKY